MFYAKKPGGSADSVAVLGFSVVEGAAERTSCSRIAWTPEAADAFSALSVAARASGDAAGLRLPLVTLRAVLSAQLPSPLYVSSDLGRIGLPDRDGGPSAIAECAGSPDECARAAALAVRAWVPGILAPWAEARGVPAELVRAVSELALTGGLVRSERRDVDLAAERHVSDGFPDLRDAIHAAAFRRLAGAELFPDLGPVRALVRSRARDGNIDFLTFPRPAGGAGWFSMRARLAVETLPGQSKPFVRLDVSRVRWCPTVPTGGLRLRQRQVSAVVFGPDERRAVSFSAPVSRGKVLEPEDPAYAMSALRAGVDPGEGFEALVAAGPRDGAFVGIPFAPGYEPAPAVASGATELDMLDCFDAVADAMRGVLEPILGTPVERGKRVARTSEDIPAMRASDILGEIARALGHNEIDDGAIAEAWDMLHGGELPRGLAVTPRAEREARRFDALRESNTARLRRIFGQDVPVIVVLSASADEARAIADIVGTLFAGRMRIEHRLLPEGVHGPKRDLPLPGAKARERYEARVAAWKPLAEALLEEFGPSRVLVNAPRFMDDPVNKIAGRVALARHGDCNVQYLDRRDMRADGWMFRIQAAVLDLMFGHSGTVSPVAGNVAEAFPDAATRPRSILGISVVAQNRTFSRVAASFFLSVSVEVATGRVTAMAARPAAGTLEYLGPMPFFDLLKAVAAWDGSEIGSGDAAASAFQEFLSDVIGEACARGENPLVLLDGAHARGLWPSISNKGLGAPATLGRRPLDMRADWPGARLVRVQDTIEPRVLTRKAKTYVPVDAATGIELDEAAVAHSVPTLTNPGRLVKLPGAANYVSSGDLDGQQKIAKGLSVYRDMPQFKAVPEADRPAAAADTALYRIDARDLGNEPYKVPGAIGILVAHCLEADDPDRVAALCHALRQGFGHTRSPVRLPAPLFQAQKVAEYIPAYVLAEQEDGPAVDDTAEDADAGIDEDAADAEGATDDASDEPGEGSREDPPAERRPADREVASRNGNPLLILSAAASRRNAETTFMTEAPFRKAASLPLLPSETRPIALKATVPEEILDLAGGDELLEEYIQLLWVGPVPRELTAGGFLDSILAMVSLKVRQRIRTELRKPNSGPVRSFLPDFDPRDEGQFRDFMLAVLNLGGMFAATHRAAMMTSRKNFNRWVFDAFYDTVQRRIRAHAKDVPPARLENLPARVTAIAKSLQAAGQGLVARRYFMLESLFLPEDAEVFAGASAEMAKTHPEEWSETASFCERLAASCTRFEDIRVLRNEFMWRGVDEEESNWVAAEDMADIEEVTALPECPETPAPALVDAAWLRDKLSLSGAFRSHLHAHRAAFNELMGDPDFWPEGKASAEAITARIARLFSVPRPILAAVSRKDRESIFRPFYRKIEGLQKNLTHGAPEFFHPDWEERGSAPSFFVLLANGGYRSYAADFAIIRAIDNPSGPLERVVSEAGEEFAEIAAFVRARRRAALWCSRAGDWDDSSIYSPFFESFDTGEHNPPPFPSDTDEPEGAAGTSDVSDPEAPEQEEETMDFATTPAPVPASAPAPVRSLDAELAQVSASASAAAAAVRDGDPDAATRLLAEARAAMSRAEAMLAEIPRLVANGPLLLRAVRLSTAVGAAAEQVGEVELPELPASGLIQPTAAELAGGELDAGEITIEAVRQAMGDWERLSTTLASASMKEGKAIRAEMETREADASRGLDSAVASLVSAAAFLRPETPSAPETKPATEPAAAETPSISGDGDAAAETPQEAAPDQRDGSADGATALAYGEDVAEGGGASRSDGTAGEAMPETDGSPIAPDDADALPDASVGPADIAASDGATEPTALDDPAALGEPTGGSSAYVSAQPEEDESDEDAFDESALDRLASAAEGGSATDGAETSTDGVIGDDLEVERINAALDRFVATGSQAFAYHLTLAAEAERRVGVRMTSDEARLSAMAGHLNHTTLQNRMDLVGSLVDAGFRAVAAINADPDQERAAARLLPTMPIILELGVFFPSSGAGELLRSFEALPGDLGSRAQDVFESVARIQKTNLTFSRAMLARVATEMDAAKAMAAARAELLRKAEQLAQLRFVFQLGTKIRSQLSRQDGLVGKLHAQLAKGQDDAATVAMVAEFATAISDRSRVVQILHDAEVAVNDRVRGIDGAARDRFVMFFGDFHATATEYLDRVAEVAAAKAAERPKVREFAKEIARSVEAMVAAVEAAAGAGPVGVAAGSAAPKLKKLADLLSGDPTTPAVTDMYQACHAAMALVPELDFGRSWLPSPYDAGRIVDLLCEADVPPLPADPAARAEAFEDAVRQRIDRGSFVGARMLLDAARFFGIAPEQRDALTEELEVNLEMATENIRSECADVRRSVERVIRIGSLRLSGDADPATNLLSRVDSIEAVQIPVEVDAEGRSEQPDPQGIYDVSVAIDVLEDVKDMALTLLDEPRNRLLRKIEALAAKGAAAIQVDRLRQLCQSDDLLTAEEFIAEAETTGKVPESRSRNRRFDEFSKDVLPRLAHQRRDMGHDVATALREGADLDPFRFSNLTETRLEESTEVHDAWRDLFRRIADPTVGAHLAAFLERIGIDARLEEPMAGTPAKRKIFWANFQARIPRDQESLLLPDFGSRTAGWYRVVLSPGMPPEATIAEMWATKGGDHGVILFVGEIVTPDQRRAFHLKNLEGRRKVLLVDAASLYYALAEPTLRPLTLLELAQPYSYVSPYHDWGKEAVPPEMFVGRQDDIDHIMATEGSCIVYGGRRMGKTAILRHLRDTRHDPDNGMLVAFVDAQGLGKVPNPTRRIWSDIAAALPEVFERAGTVGDGRRVLDGIRKWLGDDPRRRVVLLIDECDQFVVSDAHDNYAIFRDLQTLMTDTKRRFKFVLSGLSDVTRLVQTGNPPLKQISANPRRIGSLTGEERKDAEDLVLRPFAAIGVSLQRTDVWRILSHANYYPVLIQTYAKHLLELITDRDRATNKALREVGSDLVGEVLDDRKVREDIKRIFEFTLGIDPRYRLIAYVVADLALDAESEGRMAEGFSTREIRDNALTWWDAGFQDKNRFSLFDDLLDEMEGLGIVRRASDDRWTLRSSAVVRLLGNRDEVETALESFIDMEAPAGFDPRSHRRSLNPQKGTLPEARTSPLTLGQEQEILRSSSRATLVLGSAAADIALVPLALRSAPDTFPDGAIYDMRFLHPSHEGELAEAIREIKVSGSGKAIAVVAPAVSWTADWVRAAIQARNVARGSVRVVFVGGAEHAASVAADAQLGDLTAHVSRINLEPWSTTFFQDTVNTSNSAALSHRHDEVARENGGWNAPMWQLFRPGKGGQRVAAALDGEAIGLVGRYGEALRCMARVLGDSPFHAGDVDDYGQLDDALRALAVGGREVVEYGTMMGLLVAAPGKPHAEDRGSPFRLTPHALALASETKLAA